MANLIDKIGEVFVPIAQGERFERYLQFEFRKVSEEDKKANKPAKEEFVQAEANRNQKELPQTGTNSYLGAIASLVGLGVFFGVGGVKKRHEN